MSESWLRLTPAICVAGMMSVAVAAGQTVGQEPGKTPDQKPDQAPAPKSDQTPGQKSGQSGAPKPAEVDGILEQRGEGGPIQEPRTVIVGNTGTRTQFGGRNRAKPLFPGIVSCVPVYPIHASGPRSRRG